MARKRYSKKNSPPSEREFDEMIRISCETTTALAKKIAASQKFIVAGRDYYRSGVHRHREPSQLQVSALAAAIDTAAAAAELCASLHPQGCPPNLQTLTAALDDACMTLQEAQRYAGRRFHGSPPQSHRRRY